MDMRHSTLLTATCNSCTNCIIISMQPNAIGLVRIVLTEWLKKYGNKKAARFPFYFSYLFLFCMNVIRVLVTAFVYEVLHLFAQCEL